MIMNGCIIEVGTRPSLTPTSTLTVSRTLTPTPTPTPTLTQTNKNNILAPVHLLDKAQLS